MSEHSLHPRPRFVIAVLWLVTLALLEVDLVLLRGASVGDWSVLVGAVYHATVGMALVAKVVALALAAVGLAALLSRARRNPISLTTLVAGLSLVNAFFVLRTPSFLGDIRLYLTVWGLTLASVLVVVLEGVRRLSSGRLT